MNFVIDALDRVCAREKQLRSYYCGSSRSGGFYDVPGEYLLNDAAAACLMYASVCGISCLDDDALSYLRAHADYGTLLAAAKKGLADRDVVREYLLAEEKCCIISTPARLSAMKTMPTCPEHEDLPLDDVGHGPRWYADLFARIRPRFACRYAKLDAILKRLGYPAHTERDVNGMSIGDYLQNVLPKRSDYLALEFPDDSKGTVCEIKYLDRAEGERLAREGGTDSRFLFRHIDGGRMSRDAYLGVFPVTRRQQLILSGKWCLLPYAGDVPWTPSTGNPNEAYDVDECDQIVRSLRRFSGFASVELPESQLWERACRAGTSTLFNNGSDRESSSLDLGWTAMNSEHVPHPVGQKCPNALGLYDCHGNVSECCWVRDRNGLSYVFHGGSFKDMPSECTSRSCVRKAAQGTCGLRPAIYL